MASMGRTTSPWVTAAFVAVAIAFVAGEEDTNHVYSPCSDVKVQRRDGFTFGIAISRFDDFFHSNPKTQLSPCDHRLSLSSSASRAAVFRPKVDEISLLSLNSSYQQFVSSGGYMVAFAGRKYAARSEPIFIGNSSYIVTGFTLVLEFKKGTLQNLYWKRDCDSCSGANFVCLSKRDCALKASSCKSRGGKNDCDNLTIQVAFSGTDKNLVGLNSWYEVSNLEQYSLVDLYGNLKNSFGFL